MTEYKASTDEVTEIELPSAIQQIAWTRQLTAPLGEVSLEVFTQFVGNGSELQVIIKDESGKKFDKIKTNIAGNHLRKTIRVPEKAKEALYAEIKLPKHKLKQKSGPLHIIPPVEITNLQWSQQEARRGDILTLSADVKDLPDNAEVEIQIWEHDEDSAHDLITKFPALVKDGKIETEWEFEYHEDTDDIPTEEEAEKGYHPPEYFFRVNAYGVSVDSELLEFKDWIEIELMDHKGDPIGGEHYTIHLPDGKKQEGEVDKNGYAKVKDVPPGRYSIEFENHPDVELAEKRSHDSR